MKKLLILLTVLTFSCSRKTTTEAENFLLKPKEFQEKLAATKGAVLLDVRTPDEVHQEWLKGEVNFDFTAPEFKTLIAGMPRDSAYFVYCASGVRSGKASDMMKEMDFKKVYLLDGGLKAWKAEGLPTQLPLEK